MSQKKEERLKKIRDILDQQEKVRISDLADELHVTPETIRHDLNTLEEMNLVHREHGYVMGVSSLMELPFVMRGKEHVEDKRRIGWRAMSEIKDGMAVFLDAGSTTLAGLPYLTRRKDVTIVTTSLPLAYQAARLNLNVIMCGGKVANVGLRTIGPEAIEMIRPFNFDIAILGSDGISGVPGFTALDYTEVPIKHLIIQRAKYKIVVMDVSKFERKAACSFCTYDDIDMLVTGKLSGIQVDQVKGVKKIIQL